MARKKSNSNRQRKRRSKRMKSKRKIGFMKAVTTIKKHVIKGKPKTFGYAIKIAKAMNRKIQSTRVVKIPKTGGILPLIPSFAGLSALSTLSGGAAAIAKTINDAKSAKHQLEEAKRHNRSIEAIALGGKGLYLRPYKTGLGLLLRPPPQQNYY